MALSAAKVICEGGSWIAIYAVARALEKRLGIRWAVEGTREQIAIALCLLAAMEERPS
jgi:hypothetical protein